MRELDTVEIENVSGAGFFGDFGAQLGGSIGGVIDWASTAIGGKAPVASAVAPAATLGKGIGLIIDSISSLSLASVSEAVSLTGQGIAMVIQAAITNGAKPV